MDPKKILKRANDDNNDSTFFNNLMQKLGVEILKK